MHYNFTFIFKIIKSFQFFRTGHVAPSVSRFPILRMKMDFRRRPGTEAKIYFGWVVSVHSKGGEDTCQNLSCAKHPRQGSNASRPHWGTGGTTNICTRTRKNIAAFHIAIFGALPVPPKHSRPGFARVASAPLHQHGQSRTTACLSRAVEPRHHRSRAEYL